MDGRTVTSDDFPYIPIRITIEEWETEAEALLDTGFSGEIVIPETAMPEDIGPPAYHAPYRVADDREILAPVFYGNIQIPGLPPVSDIAIVVLGSRYIIGVGVIGLYRIILERGTQVIIEEP